MCSEEEQCVETGEEVVIFLEEKCNGAAQFLVNAGIVGNCPGGLVGSGVYKEEGPLFRQCGVAEGGRFTAW